MSGDVVANHYAGRPQTSSGPRELEGPTSTGTRGLPVHGEFEPLETNNWLLHLKYVRGEHETCKRLAHTELAKSQGHNEYANYVMGLILRIEGRIQESLDFFNKCRQLDPSNVDNVKQVARSHFLLGRPEQALAEYGSALKLGPPDWSLLHGLGLCYVQLGRLEEAAEALTRAVELGRTEESHRALARLHARSEPGRAIAAYRTACALFPSNPETAVELGQLHFEMADTQQAFDAWGTALCHDPAHPATLLALGAEFQRNDEPEVALTKYKLCAQRLPESSFLWNNIGMCFFAKKKFVAAISCLKRAIYLAPLDWKALYNLGLVHMHTHQFVSAFHFASASMKRNPLHVPTLLLLALALHSLADDTSARRAFEQALRLRGDSDAPELRANFAVFLKRIGQEEAARAQAELAMVAAARDPQLEQLLRAAFDAQPERPEDISEIRAEEDEV
nr:PREDICTED: Bardet-Biedl syndrome 4 protein [Bemisia tabaci]